MSKQLKIIQRRILDLNECEDAININKDILKLVKEIQDRSNKLEAIVKTCRQVIYNDAKVPDGLEKSIIKSLS